MTALTGTETLYVLGQNPTGVPAASEFQTTTSAIAALAAATVLPPIVNTAITTVGNGTLTAAAIVGGLITRSGPVAAFSDATDTAVAIVAALAAYVANESALLRIKNTTIYTQTITAGAGVTLTGTAVIPGMTEATYLVTITSTTAVTVLYVNSAPIANSVGGIGDIMLGNGLALKTDTTNAHTAKLQAYYTTGTAYETLATLTNGTTPNLNIAASTHGTVTIDGATIGSVTPAAATVTTLTTGSGGAIIAGASSGTTTLVASATAGSTTQTLPAVTGTVASTTGTNLFIADIKKCTTQKDSTSATLADIVGLTAQAVVPGTYRFRCVLPGLADGTGGVKYAFKLTTTVLTSIEATGMGYTASAVAVQHTTTTTDQTLLFDQAAAVIMTVLEGTTVVGTGGTIALQTAQHTANATSSTYVGASMEFVRIA